MLAVVDLDAMLRRLEDFQRWLEAGGWPTALLGVALTIAVLAWWRARTRLSRASRGRNRRARKAETAAERLLASKGFTILERQLSRRWTLTVDDKPVAVLSRADLLVRRRRRIFVADVKSGELAPDPSLPATRRQLLEYLLAFDADGALVVDMQKRQIRSIDFPDFFIDG